MEMHTLVKYIQELNNFDSAGHDLYDDDTFKARCKKCEEFFQRNESDILLKVNHTVTYKPSNQTTYEWKYILWNFYIVELLNNELLCENMLSVQDTKIVKVALQNFVRVGILKNLQPNLPYNINLKKRSDELDSYQILKCILTWFNNCLIYADLRMLFLPQCLQAVLLGMYQIGYCPLKKPTGGKAQGGFVMSEDLYASLYEDQLIFKQLLSKMNDSIHPAISIKETMLLLQVNSPTWFKKVVSINLTKMLRSKKGVENIACAMLEGVDNDTTTTWQIIGVLTKLIMSCQNFPDFEDNICCQVVELLRKTKTSDSLVYEQLVVSIIKNLYLKNSEQCEARFLNEVTKILVRLANKDYKFTDDMDVTDDVAQSVRLLHSAFRDDFNAKGLSLPRLKSFINVLFYLYHFVKDSNLTVVSNELKDIIGRYLKQCSSHEIDDFLESVLFALPVDGIHPLRSDLNVHVNIEIRVKSSQHVMINSTVDVADTIFKLFNTDQKIKLFGYLLKCVSNKKKYFSTEANDTLNGIEDAPTNAVLERLLAVHGILSQLSEDQCVQDGLKQNPGLIVDYINNVLTAPLNEEAVFIVIMVLDNMVTTCPKKNLIKYTVLKDGLIRVCSATNNDEMRVLINNVLNKIHRTEDGQATGATSKSKSSFDKALDNLCDPLLPVRGHALLELTKLIESKDIKAMAKKQYLLNLFQLHLKNEDSFIYLNAIRGLASLADVFTDAVLDVLCEEYSNFDRKEDDRQELRMKLGEVLMRVTKLLGDMAPKYKALLINTFLSGTRDNDHLMRASALSNLGELCRVLSFKIGTIITEVLACVHAVIATDKAVEPRRAAVTVMRQLFVGLQSEMINFLKEDILPIYRTLKEVYNNDKDDVMRLQAQLALEELNENVKTFILPRSALHTEKKIIMLN